MTIAITNRITQFKSRLATQQVASRANNLYWAISGFEFYTEEAGWQLIGKTFAEQDFKNICEYECSALGHCCADPDTGANQWMSCSQACMVRMRGSTQSECEANVCSSSSSSYNFNGFSYDTSAAFCTDSCDQGQPSEASCQVGCSLSEESGSYPTDWTATFDLTEVSQISGVNLRTKDGVLGKVLIWIANTCRPFESNLLDALGNVLVFTDSTQTSIQWTYYDDIQWYNFYCDGMTSDIDNFDWISFEGNQMILNPTYANNGDHTFNFNTVRPTETYTMNFSVNIQCVNTGYAQLEPATASVLDSSSYTVDLNSICEDFQAPGYTLTTGQTWITDNENGTLGLSNPPQDALSYAFKLIQSGSTCQSDNEELGTDLQSEAECAALCFAHDSCQFFLFVTGGNYADSCYMEHTDSAQCTEGWITDNNNDFYQLIRGVDFSLVQAGQQCDGVDNSELSPDPLATVAECAVLCQNSEMCGYFIYGTGANAGQCFAQIIMTTACETGFVTAEYDFYSLEEDVNYYLLQEYQQCGSNHIELTFDSVSIQECANLCAADAECFVFLIGAGDYEGQCWKENTASVECTEGWISASFTNCGYHSYAYGSQNMITIIRNENTAQSIPAETSYVEVLVPLDCSDLSGQLENWNSGAVSMQIGATSTIKFVYALPMDSNNKSWSYYCGFAAITLSGLPEFCDSNTVDELLHSQEYYKTSSCSPSKVAHVTTHNVSVTRTNLLFGDSITLAITVSTACSSVSYQAPGDPTSEYSVGVSGTYTPIRDAQTDADSVSWSNACGQANIQYSGLPNFMEANLSTFALTINPSTVAQLGPHEISVTQTDPNDLIPESQTTVTLTVSADCSVFNFDTLATTHSIYVGQSDSMTISNQLETDSDGTSWSGTCGAGSTFSATNLPDFCTQVNDPWSIDCDATQESQIGDHTFVVTRSHSSLAEPDIVDVTLTVAIDCSSYTWSAPGDPVTSFGIGEDGSYTPNVSMNPDDSGNTWDSQCGPATITYTNLPSFITETGISNELTISPSLVSHVNTHTVTITKSSSTGVPDLETNVDFEVTVDCSIYGLKAWESNRNAYIGEDKALSIYVGYELDGEEVSWSQQCGWAEVEYLSSLPEFCSIDTDETAAWQDILNCSPTTQAQLDASPYQIDLRRFQTSTGISEDVQMQLTIEIECQYIQWAAVSSPTDTTFNIPEDTLFTPDRNTMGDTDGNWNDACGVANLVYSNLPAFATATSGASQYLQEEGGYSCRLPLEVIDTEESCQLAATALGSTWNGVVDNQDNRPAGCFWDTNGGVYLNTNLDPNNLTWAGVGGVCTRNYENWSSALCEQIAISQGKTVGGCGYNFTQDDFNSLGCYYYDDEVTYSNVIGCMFYGTVNGGDITSYVAPSTGGVRPEGYPGTYDYTYEAAGQNCQSPLETIQTEEECIIAAAQLGLTWQSSGPSTARPKGCFTQNEVYFNTEQNPTDTIPTEVEAICIINTNGVTISPRLVSQIGTTTINVTKTDPDQDDGDVVPDLVTTFDIVIGVNCDLLPFQDVTQTHSAYINNEFSYTIPNEHEVDADGASWTPHCGTATISQENMPSPLCSLSDNVLTCNAQSQADIDTYSFTIVQTKDSLVTSTEITLTVGVDCQYVTWAQPSNPSSAFNIGEGGSFTPGRNTSEDASGNYNSYCGLPNLSFPNLQSWIFMKATYSEADAGTSCQGDFNVVESERECIFAAAELGIPWAGYSESSTNRPLGCFTSGSEVWRNTETNINDIELGFQGVCSQTISEDWSSLLCEQLAAEQGKTLGGCDQTVEYEYEFRADHYNTRGCYAYSEGPYESCMYYGTVDEGNDVTSFSEIADLNAIRPDGYPGNYYELTIQPYLVSHLGTQTISVTMTDANADDNVVPDLTTSFEVEIAVDCDLLPFAGVTSAHTAQIQNPFTYTVPNEKEVDSEGASWNDHCATATISATDLPTFCSLEDNILSCTAVNKSDVQDHTFTIIQTLDGLETETTITLTVEVDCQYLAWAVPSNPADDLIVIPDGNTWSPDRNMAEDENGVNWNEECGTANIEIYNQGAFVTISTDGEFIMTFAPNQVAHVGTNTFTLRKIDPNGIVADLDTTISFEVTVDTSQFSLKGITTETTFCGQEGTQCDFEGMKTVGYCNGCTAQCSTAIKTDGVTCSTSYLVDPGCDSYYYTCSWCSQDYCYVQNDVTEASMNAQVESNNYYYINVELEWDSNGVSWSTVSEYATVTAQNLPDYCTLATERSGSTWTLTCSPQDNADVDNSPMTATLTRSTTSGLSEDTELVITVTYNCSSFSYKVPTAPDQTFYVNTPETWTAPNEVRDDSQGVSWSGKCGYATLTYIATYGNAQAITQDGDDLVIEATLTTDVTQSDTMTSAPLSITVTQTDNNTENSSYVPTATTEIFINIEPDCQQFEFEAPEDLNLNIVMVSILTEAEKVMPLRYELDENNNSWSTHCGYATDVTVENLPEFCLLSQTTSSTQRGVICNPVVEEHIFNEYSYSMTRASQYGSTTDSITITAEASGSFCQIIGWEDFGTFPIQWINIDETYEYIISDQMNLDGNEETWSTVCCYADLSVVVTDSETNEVITTDDYIYIDQENLSLVIAPYVVDQAASLTISVYRTPQDEALGREEISTFSFIIACVLTELVPDPAYSLASTRTFTLDVDSAYTMAYPTFTQVPICNQPLLYEVLLDQALYDSTKTWITFDDENQQLVVEPDSSDLLGLRKIQFQVTGEFTDPLASLQPEEILPAVEGAKEYFDIVNIYFVQRLTVAQVVFVPPTRVIQNPRFRVPLENHFKNQGEVWYYKLPDFFDPEEGLKVTLSLTMTPTQAEQYIIYEEAQQSLFIEHSNKLEKAEKVTFTIELVTDPGLDDIVRSEKYQFLLEIQKPPEIFEFDLDTFISSESESEEDLIPNPKAEIKEVSSYGSIGIEFDQAMDVPDFLPDDRVMQIFLVGQQGKVKGKYFPPEHFQESRRMLTGDEEFLKWSVLNMTESNLDIQLEFQQPLDVSTDKRSPDQIQIEFFDEYFKSQETGKPLEITGELNNIQYNLPQQFPSKAEALQTEAVAEALGKSTTYALVGICIAQLFAGQIIKKMIPLFLTLQLILYMITQMNFPSNVDDVFKELKDAIELKKLNELVVGALEDSSWKETIAGIQAEAEESGLIIFIAPPLCILILICAVCCLKFCKKLACIQKLCQTLYKTMIFSMFLNIGMISYLTFAKGSGVGNGLITDEEIEIIPGSPAKLGIIILFLAFSYFFALFADSPSNQDDPEFQQKYQVLYKKYRHQKLHGGLYVFYFFVKRIWFVTVFKLGLCFSVIFGQLWAQQTIWLCYFFNYHPIDDSKDQNIETFNESIFLLFVYMLPTYNYINVNAEDRLKLGWWAIYIIGFMIAANLIVVIINILRQSIQKRKYKAILKKKKKDFDKKMIVQKYMMNELQAAQAMQRPSSAENLESEEVQRNLILEGLPNYNDISNDQRLIPENYQKLIPEHAPNRVPKKNQDPRLIPVKQIVNIPKPKESKRQKQAIHPITIDTLLNKKKQIRKMTNDPIACTYEESNESGDEEAKIQIEPEYKAQDLELEPSQSPLKIIQESPPTVRLDHENFAAQAAAERKERNIAQAEKNMDDTLKIIFGPQASFKNLEALEIVPELGSQATIKEEQKTNAKESTKKNTQLQALEDYVKKITAEAGISIGNSYSNGGTDNENLNNGSNFASPETNIYYNKEIKGKQSLSNVQKIIQGDFGGLEKDEQTLSSANSISKKLRLASYAQSDLSKPFKLNTGIQQPRDRTFSEGNALAGAMSSCQASNDKFRQQYQSFKSTAQQRIAEMFAKTSDNSQGLQVQSSQGLQVQSSQSSNQLQAKLNSTKLQPQMNLQTNQQAQQEASPIQRQAISNDVPKPADGKSSRLAAYDKMMDDMVAALNQSPALNSPQKDPKHNKINSILDSL